jgi:galactokinase
VPFNPKGYRLVLLNTCVTHNLAGGEYNKRRESCERVVAAIAAVAGNGYPVTGNPTPDTVAKPQFLRDVSMEQLQSVKNEVDPVDYMRSEFVVEEIQRLLDACAAMEKDDYETVGKKMYETHEGLSKLYEVSCPELDFLNDMAKECGVTGSRVMGGGFGGCTINLVKENLHDDFVKKACEAYEKKFGITPKVYDVVIKDGARKL